MSESEFEPDFEPDKRSVEDLFVSPDYYIIPRFQRPYSWDRSNLDDFWRDVVYDNKIGYFIGPMVAWRTPGSSQRRVVDGQQRLTTIVIIFTVIRDALRGLGQTNLADGIQRYLEKPDRDNVLRFTLQTEAATPYLNRGLLLDPPDQDLQPQNEEERALYQAHKQLSELVDAEVEKLSEPVLWLTGLRDKLLGLRVIWVEHTDEDNAYIIFETLNSRGKDLEVADLLKNLLFSRLRSQGNPQADTVRDQWNEMRAIIERRRTATLEVNRFILHWWLSREEYVAQRKLFRAIKAKIRSEPQAERCLSSLRSDVVLYTNALDPDSKTWPLEEDEIKRSLSALEDFRIMQPAPLLLSLLRARFNSDPALRTPQLITTLKTIERYHFQYTVVAQLSSSGGVSEMYAKAARELFRSCSNQARTVVLREFRAKLVDRAPTRDQFVSGFADRFVLTNDVTRDNKLVRYVLRSILRELQPTTGLENLTVEHVMSQDQIGRNGIDASTVGSIGNLLLVSDELNTRLANKAFATKRQLLQSVGAPYDIGGILDRRSWGAAEITRRTNHLAELAYNTVWKLPV